jgi:hypothetical protein
MLSTNHQLCCPRPYFLIRQSVSRHSVSSGSSIFMWAYGNLDACLQVLPNFLAIRSDVTSLSGDLLLPRACVTNIKSSPSWSSLPDQYSVHFPANPTNFPAFCGRHSIASRFEHLLHEARWTKMVMLHYAAECVTDDVLETVVHIYPAVSSVFPTFFPGDPKGFRFWCHGTGMLAFPRHFHGFFLRCSAVYLDLISDHPNFHILISKACGSSPHYTGDYSPFVARSHRQVFAWRPDPWLISTITDFHVIEQLLTEAQNPNEEEYRDNCEGVKLYSSATATCIATLSRLTTNTRMQMRSIILREECRSISNHEVHAEGLVKFCKENPKLRVVMHAGFATNFSPSLWADRGAALSPPRNATRTRKYDYVRIAVDWLIRTAALPLRGMPSRSFTLFLDVCSEGATYLWRYIQHAASARAQLPEFVLGSDVNCNKWVLMNMFATLWRLLIQFSSVISDIVNGESLIQLHLPVGQLWQEKIPSAEFRT